MILVDMEMPESCEKCNMQYICKVRDNVGGVVGFHKMNLDKNRHPDCPIKTEIPDDATNGDVFKLLFPHIPKEKFFYKTDWWNAPYKVESEEKSI